MKYSIVLLCIAFIISGAPIGRPYTWQAGIPLVLAILALLAVTLGIGPGL